MWWLKVVVVTVTVEKWKTNVVWWSVWLCRFVVDVVVDGVVGSAALVVVEARVDVKVDDREVADDVVVVVQGNNHTFLQDVQRKSGEKNVKLAPNDETEAAPTTANEGDDENEERAAKKLAEESPILLRAMAFLNQKNVTCFGKADNVTDFGPKKREVGNE